MSTRKERREAERKTAYSDVFHYGKDIVETDIFKKALAQTHHKKTTVGDHSACVAVIALRMCRSLNRRVCHLDERRVVLAALTHDLGIVGRHEKSIEGIIISIADKMASVKDISARAAA